MVLASRASTDSLLDMRLPPASICSDRTCVVAANVTALYAKCIASSRLVSAEEADDLQVPLQAVEARQLWKPQNHTGKGITRCNPYGKATCVTLKGVSDYNFTSGFSNECHQAFEAAKENKNSRHECPPGDFAVITGAWITIISSDNSEVPNTGVMLHQVDCRIQHGNANVEQIGGSSPSIDRASFHPSSARIQYYPVYGRQNSGGHSDPSVKNQPYDWQLQYLERRSPWTFASERDEDGRLSDSSPISSYVMAPKNGEESSPYGNHTNNSQMVAETVEASFDIATSLAFARAPHAAFLSITTDARNRWTYDPRVLCVLAIPLLATMLLLCGCRKVYGDEVVVGYDPIGIAQRASEISPTTFGEDYNSEKSERTKSTMLKEEDGPDEAQPLSLEYPDLERGREAMESLMFRTASSFQEEYEHAASLIGREDHGSREGDSEMVGSDQSEVDGSSSHRRLGRRPDSPVSVSSQPK